MARLVSVVIPIFNSEKYLADCISSVIKQTYHLIEVLLIDDGSTDRSGAICDSFAQSDARIRVVHKPNGGVSSARNEGIRRARGDYITFIDSDDTVNSGMIEEMLFQLDQYDADVVVTALNEDFNCPESTCVSINAKEVSWICYFLERFLIFGPCQKLYKMELIVKHNISFPECMSYGEDLVFNMEYLKKADKIGFINNKQLLPATSYKVGAYIL